MADHIGCDIKVINRLVNGRTSVSAELALKLGASFGTSPEFWLNAQRAVDLYIAEQEIDELPDSILDEAVQEWYILIFSEIGIKNG